MAATLSSESFSRDVRHDEVTAAQLGIHGVPFFKLGRYGVSGAQPKDVLLELLVRARSELDAPDESESANAVCGPDGCM